MKFPWPDVFPKGKKAKEQKKADYRTSLFAYVSRYCPELDGTSGIRRMMIEIGHVKVNHIVITNPKYQIKPGDIVHVRGWRADEVGEYNVTASDIERTW